MNKSSFLYYCQHCNRVCESACFDRHRSQYYCHDKRCPGFDLPRDSSSRAEALSRSSSKRYTAGDGRSSGSRPSRPGDGIRYIERRELRSVKPTDLCIFRIEQTGERLTYTRNPNLDRDHLYLLKRCPAPQRGYRYGYDSAGKTIAFPVGPEADDYYDPADAERSSRSRRPSRSVSTSSREGNHERRSYSTVRELRRELDGGARLERSYSTRETRRDDDEGGRGAGLGRGPSIGRGRNQSSCDEYAGGAGRSYDSMRSRYPPEPLSRSYSTRRGRSEAFLRPEAAYEEPRQRVVKPEDVGWEIETVLE